MKRILRIFLISVFALWLTARLIDGISIEGGNQTLFFAAAVFTAINLFIRPLLRLLFLPLNLLTLGMFSWVANLLVLYLLVLIVPQVKISPFDFPGFLWSGFTVPAMHLNFIFALAVSSFLISFISSFLNWLAK
ncbi:MAG: phage holin family protein [bacterium]|nr:phage holin family protein [bacterium]